MELCGLIEICYTGREQKLSVLEVHDNERLERTRIYGAGHCDLGTAWFGRRAKCVSRRKIFDKSSCVSLFADGRIACRIKEEVGSISWIVLFLA